MYKIALMYNTVGNVHVYNIHYTYYIIDGVHILLSSIVMTNYMYVTLMWGSL